MEEKSHLVTLRGPSAKHFWDGMVNYLRIFQPEDANREFATEFLKYLKLTARRTGRIEPDELEKQLEAYNKSKSD